MKITDYIYYYPNAVDNKLCDALIGHFDKNAEWKQSTFSTAYKSTGTSEVSMSEYWIPKDDAYYNPLLACFQKTIEDYSNVFKTFKPMVYAGFRINSYSKGGFMKNHVDSIHHSHGQDYGYPHVTSLIFLNDNYSGGQFVIRDKSITKKQGSAVVFPSNFMYPHEVKKVTKGKRYSVMTWIM